MKPGRYKVTVEIDFPEQLTYSEAVTASMGVFEELIEEGLEPEVEFRLVQELDMEYHTDDVVEELEF
jgi:hypothetical protein